MDQPLSSKQRASRIPLDYHARPERMRVRRSLLTGLAATVAIALVGVINGSRAWHAKAVSPGPVSRVHATWDEKCMACHDAFAPLHNGHWMASGAMAVADDGETERRSLVADSKCRACHPGAPHHSHPIAGPADSCTACHHEHRGRDASLTTLNDRACTQCHNRIEQFLVDKSPEPKPQVPIITGFHREHPEFRSLDRDPTRLKFNHQRHLTAGLRLPDEIQPEWTVRDVSEPFRERYRRGEGGSPNDIENDKDDSIPVQLVCADCHRTAASTAAAVPRPFEPLDKVVALAVHRESSTDDDMLPVTFEQHCQGCHPLVYHSARRDTVPHGHDFAGLRHILIGRLWESPLPESQKLGPSRSRLRPIPGKRSQAAEREVAAGLNEQLFEAERQLWGVTCAKCHDVTGALGGETPPVIIPVNMPVRWLQRSRFNHTTHRAVGCRECHAQAFVDSTAPSTKTSDVLIAGRAKCRECHSPQGENGHHGGADFRCVECHRYHRPHLTGREGPIGTDSRIEHSVKHFLEGAHAQD